MSRPVEWRLIVVGFIGVALSVLAIIVGVQRAWGQPVDRKPAATDSLLATAAIDEQRTIAMPGRVKPPAGMFALSAGRAKGGWQTTAGGQAGDAEYVIAFNQPTRVGTVVVGGDWRVSYAKPGGSVASGDDAGWVEAEVVSSPTHQLRYVVLPPGVRTEALRIAGQMKPTDKGEYLATLQWVNAMAGRWVNVAPLAWVTVSSSDKRDQGFRPDPRRNNPQALNDGMIGSRGWSSAPTEQPITESSPQWIVLDWPSERTLRACSIFVNDSEIGFGRMLVQRWTGQGKAQGENRDQWQTVGEIQASQRGGGVSEMGCDFGQDVRTRALRFWVVQGAGKNNAQVGMSQIAVLEDVKDRAAVKWEELSGQQQMRGVPIDFEMPANGKATIQILNEQGQVIQNLVSGQAFGPGRQRVWWDLSTVGDWSPYSRPAGDVTPATGPMAQPGRYRWRGLWHEGLSLEYVETFNPIKKQGVGWITADRTGGWLADHAAPRDVVRVGQRMWQGTFAEGGHALLEADTDARKLWGTERIWLACPRVMAADGKFLYYMDQGGWVGKSMVMIQVNTGSKETRRVLVQTIDDKKEYESKQAANLSDRSDLVNIEGLAVIGDRAWIADRAANKIMVVDLKANLAAKKRGFSWTAVGQQFDDEKMNVLAEIKLDKPGRIRPFDERRLAAVSGSTVVLIDRSTHAVRPVITGLSNPLGLAVDEQKRIYVGEMEPVHQVKVFSADGKLLRTIGKPGPHRIGAFDEQNMESPAGLEVDAAGNLWVCEFNNELKRTSIWDQQGRCVNQVIGPPEYGGGGDIDPRDATRYFYRGQEYQRDSSNGEIRLTRILWRADDKTYPSWGGHPGYPFYHGGKLFFMTWSGPFGKVTTLTLWVYDKDRLRPVAAMGQSDDKDRAVFAWTDLNDNGRMDEGEMRQGAITYQGRAWSRLGTSWQWRMNDQFQAATSDGGSDGGRGGYGAAGIAFFHVERLTDAGYPVYKLPTTFFQAEGRHACDAVFTDAAGNAIALDQSIYSMKPDGTIAWRYKSAWPGLHAGHSTTARGDEPGVIVAPTRFFGSFIANPQVGQVVAISGNLGTTYLMTTDGLFVDQIWKDVRRGTLLRTSQKPTVELANQLTLSDEHFGGTIARVSDAAGRSFVRYVVSPGSPHCAVYQLNGVENIHRIAGENFEVTAEHYARQQQVRQDRAYLAATVKQYAIKRMKQVTVDGKPDEWPGERINGFALGYDEKNLYVLYQGKDEQAVFANAATDDDFVDAFTKGDLLDVMLQTRAGLDAARKQAQQGDKRLSFTMIGGKPAAILYDYVVPGTPDRARLPFASPWQVAYVDRVERLSDVRITVQRTSDGFTLEAAVPLKTLALDPAATPTTRGDVGVVASDASGSSSVDRTYWSNPNTKIMSDLPSETRLQPNLWGTFTFEP